MRPPYLGDLDKAHRLNAARRAAGYASVRAAASAFGWSLATYRAHEGATRIMPEAAARRYATAFGVDPDWLWTGKSKDGEPGLPVDQARAAKYAARAKHIFGTAPNDPAELAFVRLRVARRLAGYWSIKETAERLGVGRTALSAQESGQNRLSAKSVKVYADAFGVHEQWLRTGALPSGYDIEIEAMLDGLMRLHEESEGAARRLFPPLVARSPTSDPGRLRKETTLAPSRGEPAGDTVPELAFEALGALLGGENPASLPHERTWHFPSRFLPEIWSCAPESAIVLVCVGSTSGKIRPGDRVVVDTASKTPLRGALYAHLGNYGVEVVKSDQPNRRIIGRACGLIGGLKLTD
jgi:transcriptional regulator with XRE-family HTH domain